MRARDAKNRKASGEVATSHTGIYYCNAKQAVRQLYTYLGLIFMLRWLPTFGIVKFRLFSTKFSNNRTTNTCLSHVEIEKKKSNEKISVSFFLVFPKKKLDFPNFIIFCVCVSHKNIWILKNGININ